MTIGHDGAALTSFRPRPKQGPKGEPGSSMAAKLVWGEDGSCGKSLHFLAIKYETG